MQPPSEGRLDDEEEYQQQTIFASSVTEFVTWREISEVDTGEYL